MRPMKKYKISLRNVDGNLFVIYRYFTSEAEASKLFTDAIEIEEVLG